MALSKAMEEMLATMKDEKVREVFRAQLEADPAVREHFEGNLRQADYDRNMNANKTELERLKGLEESAKKWEKWATENVPKHEKALTELAAKDKELEDLRTKAGNAGNNNGNEGVLTEAQILEKLNKELATKGYVSQAQLDAAIKAAADAREKTFMEKTFPSTVAWSSTLNDLQWQHRDEFKAPLDTVAFSKFLVEKNIADPRQGYDMFVSEPRGKLHEAKLREEIEKDIRSKLNLPGTGAPPAPEIGPLQARLQGAKPPVEIPAEVQPGDGRLAAMAAAELRTEGKF
jgi:hypothetical protein